MTPEMVLTTDESHVLGWLDADDRGGLYGECKGRTLDHLQDKGLVQLPDPLSDWGYVTLTPFGRATLDRLRRAQ